MIVERHDSYYIQYSTVVTIFIKVIYKRRYFPP